MQNTNNNCLLRGVNSHQIFPTCPGNTQVRNNLPNVAQKVSSCRPGRTPSNPGVTAAPVYTLVSGGGGMSPCNTLIAQGLASLVQPTSAGTSVPVQPQVMSTSAGTSAPVQPQVMSTSAGTSAPVQPQVISAPVQSQVVPPGITGTTGSTYNQAASAEIVISGQYVLKAIHGKNNKQVLSDLNKAQIHLSKAQEYVDKVNPKMGDVYEQTLDEIQSLICKVKKARKLSEIQQNEIAPLMGVLGALYTQL